MSTMLLVVIAIGVVFLLGKTRAAAAPTSARYLAETGGFARGVIRTPETPTEEYDPAGITRASYLEPRAGSSGDVIASPDIRGEAVIVGPARESAVPYGGGPSAADRDYSSTLSGNTDVVAGIGASGTAGESAPIADVQTGAVVISARPSAPVVPVVPSAGTIGEAPPAIMEQPIPGYYVPGVTVTVPEIRADTDSIPDADMLVEKYNYVVNTLNATGRNAIGIERITRYSGDRQFITYQFESGVIWTVPYYDFLAMLGSQLVWFEQLYSSNA